MLFSIFCQSAFFETCQSHSPFQYSYSVNEESDLILGICILYCYFVPYNIFGCHSYRLLKSLRLIVTSFSPVHMSTYHS